MPTTTQGMPAARAPVTAARSQAWWGVPSAYDHSPRPKSSAGEIITTRTKGLVAGRSTYHCRP